MASRHDEPVTLHMHRDFSFLRTDQTVTEALAWLRDHPPAARVIYFYVVDDAGVLRGVMPTRKLILGAPEARVADIMQPSVIAIPNSATVLEACKFFVLHRLLAFPVVDGDGRLIGMVDVDLYTSELARQSESVPAARFLRPLARFFQIESAGGIVLLVCTLISLLLANSWWSAEVAGFWNMPAGLDIGGIGLTKPLLHWINDGLMTLFFFVVGLEIKREFVTGELREARKAALPIVAALGGMVAPAGIFLLLQWNEPTVHGWGVPMATDIAFVVGFLVLLGPRVPQGLKVLLLTLAIADDIGAIVVIALGYHQNLALLPLLLGVGAFGLVAAARWAGVRHWFVYVVLGAIVWVCVLKSGVHPTVVGVALGMLTPARPWLGDRTPIDAVTDLLQRFGALQGEQVASVEAVSPADRLIHLLHPWVAFAIIPLFALANAGVAVNAQALEQPVAWAIAAGLVLGKPLGIVVFSILAVVLGLAKYPEGVNARVLIGAGCLAGIGFTMSLFIASLAFDNADQLGAAKIGVLVGSTVCAILGIALLLAFLNRETRSA
jgi:NhaA family Na+:H+ antiporter